MRILDVSRAHPPSSVEVELLMAIRRAFNCNITDIRDSRLLYVFGIWAVDGDVKVSSWCCEPNFVTSIIKFTGVDGHIVKNAYEGLAITSPSTNEKDNNKLTINSGFAVSKGRMSMAIAAAVEHMVGGPIQMQVDQIQMHNYALVYAIQYGATVNICIPSHDSITMIRDMLPSNTVSQLEGNSLTIYAVSCAPNEITSVNRNVNMSMGKNGNVKISANGVIRYVGGPRYVEASHRRLYAALDRIFSEQYSMRTYLQTLSVVDRF
jgi:hypothetical protein